MRFLALIVAAAPLFLAACPEHIGSVDAGVPDGGVQVITCSDAPDCPQEVPVCAAGVCKRPCAANDGCVDAATFCNGNTGFCEAGCRDSSACSDGQVCSGGSCIASQGCGTKCDCEVGLVCVAGACQQPPASCSSPDDCGNGGTSPDLCNDLACNGFTHLCFDPTPTACTGDADCLGRPGCAGGCTCVVDTGACSTDVQCTVATEEANCDSGFFCVGGTCQAAAACTTEADCTPSGLTCNSGTGQCERSRACSGPADCTSPPNTFCDNASGHCAPALCTNGGLTCGANQTCAADGRCVTQGPGGPCTADSACQATEYCSLVNGQGQCTVGCRNNGSCTNGQQCDGTHTCVGGGGGLGGFQAPCTDSSECSAGLTCGLFSNTCQEECDANSGTGDCSVDGCCQLSGQPCCTAVFGQGFCKSTGC